MLWNVTRTVRPTINGATVDFPLQLVTVHGFGFALIRLYIRFRIITSTFQQYLLLAVSQTPLYRAAICRIAIFHTAFDPSLRSRREEWSSAHGFLSLKPVQHGLNTLSRKINCYFRAFLSPPPPRSPSSFSTCPPPVHQFTRALFSRISLPNFLSFPERNHQIPRDSGKGGDGLIAIPGRPAAFFSLPSLIATPL